MLTPAQYQKAEIITSEAENGVPCPDYGYSEDIKDGRGVTNGRAGFCTGTGDAITVLQCYDDIKPNNSMQKFMPAMVAINAAFDATKGLETFKNGSYGNVTGLGTNGADFIAAWKALGSDADFKACQDAASDAIYYGSSLRHALSKGFTFALTKTVLWDSQVNMGEVNPVYGMVTMIALADKMTGTIGNPPSAAEETKWLGNFLAVRLKIMQNDKTYCNCTAGQTVPCTTPGPTDQCTTDWKGDTARITTYQSMLTSGNTDMSQPFTMEGVKITTVGTSGAADGKVCPQ